MADAWKRENGGLLPASVLFRRAIGNCRAGDSSECRVARKAVNWVDEPWKGCGCATSVRLPEITMRSIKNNALDWGLGRGLHNYFSVTSEKGREMRKKKRTSRLL